MLKQYDRLHAPCKYGVRPLTVAAKPVSVLLSATPLTVPLNVTTLSGVFKHIIIVPDAYAYDLQVLADLGLIDKDTHITLIQPDTIPSSDVTKDELKTMRDKCALMLKRRGLNKHIHRANTTFESIATWIADNFDPKWPKYDYMNFDMCNSLTTRACITLMSLPQQHIADTCRFSATFSFPGRQEALVRPRLLSVYRGFKRIGHIQYVYPVHDYMVVPTIDIKRKMREYSQAMMVNIIGHLKYNFKGISNEIGIVYRDGDTPMMTFIADIKPKALSIPKALLGYVYSQRAAAEYYKTLAASTQDMVISRGCDLAMFIT